MKIWILVFYMSAMPNVPTVGKEEHAFLSEERCKAEGKLYSEVLARIGGVDIQPNCKEYKVQQ